MAGREDEGRHEQGLFLSKKREYNTKVKRALQKVRQDYKHLRPPLVGGEFVGSPQVDPKYLTISEPIHSPTGTETPFPIIR